MRLNHSVILGLSQNPVNNKSTIRFWHKARMTVAILALSLIPTLSSNFTFADPPSISSSTEVSLSISEVISLSLSSPCDISGNLTLNITPTSTGVISTCPQTITVDTNTPGFELYAKVDSTNLTHTSIPSANPIPSNYGNTASSLTTNTWGYAIPTTTSANNNTNGIPSTLLSGFNSTYQTLASQPLASHTTAKFKSLATTDTLIKDYEENTYNPGDQTANNNQTTIYYATGADMTATAGQYSTEITYTAIGEPIPTPVYYLTNIATKNNITTMQQLTSTLCASATYDQTNNGTNANNTITLTDTRNSQQYNVRKLADNKCWQIDNMKLAGVTLTSADSNVTTNFVLPPNLITSTVTHGNGRCDSGGTLANGSGYLTCDGTDTRIATDLGFAAIVDPSANTYCAGTTNMPPDTITKCGYLYNWYTATAGTGTYDQSITGSQIPDSICPANWRLPTATSTTSGPGNDTSYNYADFAVLNTSMNANTYTTPGTTSGSFASWQPSGSFAGVFSGNWTNTLNDQSLHSDLWSSSVHSAYITRLASFSTSSVSPGSAGGDKRDGFAVRCVL